jgi:hypothetical protein
VGPRTLRGRGASEVSGSWAAFTLNLKMLFPRDAPPKEVSAGMVFGTTSDRGVGVTSEPDADSHGVKGVQ